MSPFLRKFLSQVQLITPHAHRTAAPLHLGHDIKQIADRLFQLIERQNQLNAASAEQAERLELGGADELGLEPGDRPLTATAIMASMPLHPEDRARVVAQLEASLASGQPFEATYRLRRADGVYRWAIDSASGKISRAGLLSRPVGTVGDRLICAPSAWASGRMSPGRSRSAGMAIGNTLRR